jgi:hypothetical protein
VESVFELGLRPKLWMSTKYLNPCQKSCRTNSGNWKHDMDREKSMKPKDGLIKSVSFYIGFKKESMFKLRISETNEKTSVWISEKTSYIINWGYHYSKYPNQGN